MKRYTLEMTDNPDLKRVVDRQGNWREYYHVPTKAFLRGVTTILDEAYPKGKGFMNYLLSVSPEEAKERLETAGERGDQIHQMITQLLVTGHAHRGMTVLGEDDKTEVGIDDDKWGSLLSFAEFWNRHDAELIAQNRSVCNITLGYAGTLDAVVRLKKACPVKVCPCDELVGLIGLYDWKSSGAIYDSYGAQVAAYYNADYKDTPIDYTAILRVGTNHKTTGGYQLEAYNHTETGDHMREFVAAKFLAGVNYKPFDPMALEEEIPEKISLNKPAHSIVAKVVKEAGIGKLFPKEKTVLTKKKLSKIVKKSVKKPVPKANLTKKKGHAKL